MDNQEQIQETIKEVDLTTQDIAALSSIGIPTLQEEEISEQSDVSVESTDHLKADGAAEEALQVIETPVVQEAPETVEESAEIVEGVAQFEHDETAVYKYECSICTAEITIVDGVPVRSCEHYDGGIVIAVA